jgi:endonuclease YncB( thermonuclease family)
VWRPARIGARWVLGLLALLGAASFDASALAETFYDGRVESVVDGDTIEIVIDGAPRERLRIRLANIDTPEHDQPWGARARQALVARVAGRAVRVNAVTTDRYGRVVGEVYADDVCVNCELVRDGHAWVYRRYSDDAALILLEDDAREHRRGLWSLPAAEQVPPWEWRRGRRTATPRQAAPDPVPEGATRVGCTAKKTCREMQSCEEARFHLTACGLSSLDGDGDGTPCEELCHP